MFARLSPPSAHDFTAHMFDRPGGEGLVARLPLHLNTECFLVHLYDIAGQHHLAMSEAEDLYLKRKKKSFCRMWCEMWFILARSSESYRAAGIIDGICSLYHCRKSNVTCIDQQPTLSSNFVGVIFVLYFKGRSLEVQALTEVFTAY